MPMFNVAGVKENFSRPFPMEDLCGSSSSNQRSALRLTRGDATVPEVSAYGPAGRLHSSAEKRLGEFIPSWGNSITLGIPRCLISNTEWITVGAILVYSNGGKWHRNVAIVQMRLGGAPGHLSQCWLTPRCGSQWSLSRETRLELNWSCIAPTPTLFVRTSELVFSPKHARVMLWR